MFELARRARNARMLEDWTQLPLAPAGQAVARVTRERLDGQMNLLAFEITETLTDQPDGADLPVTVARVRIGPGGTFIEQLSRL